MLSTSYAKILVSTESPAPIQNAAVIEYDSPLSTTKLSFHKPANGDLYSPKVPMWKFISVRL